MKKKDITDDMRQNIIRTVHMANERRDKRENELKEAIRSKVPKLFEIFGIER